MARKVVDVVINDEGRDKGKVFVITEMPATQAEKWGARVILAIAKGGAEIPDDIANQGMAGLASLGIRMLFGASWRDIEPLMDEMFSCIMIKPDALTQPEFKRPLTENDIEEIATRLRLRAEVFALHTGFSIPGFDSIATPGKPLI